MDFAEQLHILQSARENPALLALAMVDLVHHRLLNEERARIKYALVAAAVPHWCDPTYLAALMETTPEEATSLLDHLRALTVVEPFSARGAQAVNVHEEVRLALRDHLRTTDAARWTALSTHAHNYTSTDTTAHARIEALYHLFAVNQQSAAETYRKLNEELQPVGHPEIRHALRAALGEHFIAAWLTSDTEVTTLLLPLFTSEKVEMPASIVKTLSPRQNTILNWMKNGKTNWQISQILGVSETTVRLEVERIFSELEVRSRAQAVEGCDTMIRRDLTA